MKLLLTTALAALCVQPAIAQESRTLQRTGKIHITGYVFDLELTPATHQLKAKVQVRFTPDEDGLTATLDLNNNLRPSKVTDAAGKSINVERFQQEGTIRLTFDGGFRKGAPNAFNIEYDGTLQDGQNQPVEGLKLAYVGDPVSYLLYPGRWFPIANYQIERFTADFKVTVPATYKVIAPGISQGPPTTALGGKLVYSFRDNYASFPGSIAVLRGDAVRVASGGAPVNVYFRGPERPQADVYGEGAGKMLTYFANKFGPSKVRELTLVEIEDGSVNSYAGPGIIFLSPAGIGSKLNTRLMANEIGHQWWRYIVSPSSRANLWLDEGMGAYCEMLFTEEATSRAAADEIGREFEVLALSSDTTPVMRPGNLDEYSPEWDATLAKKPAVVMNMLRNVTGDEPFFTALREFLAKHEGEGGNTDQFRETMEKASKQNLEGFFIQWLESTGAPEFKSEYTVFRTRKGFRIDGKIRQDLDTFKMPVDIRIETDGNPENQKVMVSGTSSDFSVETFGRPRKVYIDPENRVLKYSPSIRVKVAIAKGQQLAEAGEYDKALKEYQKALDQNKNSSLAHFRVAEVFFNQGNYQPAANAFRDALNGDRDPAWTEVWSHISLGKIYDITNQRDRAVNEYSQAKRTRDDTQGAQAEAEKYLKEAYKRERKSQ